METPPTNLPLRPSARVFLVNKREELLMFNEPQGGRSFWFTPGGGINESESASAAAVRELREETGIDVTEMQLGPMVATSGGDTEYRDEALWSMDSFFFLRVDEVDIDYSGMEDYEAGQIQSHRWWDLADIETTSDTVLPLQLTSLVRRLLAGESWSEPIHLPWWHDPQRTES